jgi:hypothetical protein
MPTFKYAIVSDTDEKLVLTRINEMGAQGWRAVTLTLHGGVIFALLEAEVT